MVANKGFIKKVFPGQTEVYEGKVRVVRTVGEVLVAETTDDISAFDKVLPIKIRNKGLILNMLAVHFMNATKDIIPNCLLSVPNPRIALWKKTKPFKFEVIVRAYMEGSMWREQYSKGERNLWGYALPEGIKYQQELPELMFTPSTKAPDGKHDAPINKQQILEQGLAAEEEYQYIYEKSFELFRRGQEMAKERGLILADTKYEFGKDKNGTIMLIDEIHTPDSSRYYYLEGYETKFARGEEQRPLSKEFVRKWLIDHGYKGEDGPMPEFPNSFVESVQLRYMELFETMMGKRFEHFVGPDDYAAMSNSDLLYSKTLEELIKIRPQVEGPSIAILMGSKSDYDKGPMKEVTALLIAAGVTFELGVVSAHRTPEDVEQYAKNARTRGVKVIIAAAGGAAHLPGMLAANTILPIIGVPVNTAKALLGGLDAVFSQLQMPAGVPVGVMSVDGAENASIYALQILATSDQRIAEFLLEHKKQLKTKVYNHRAELTEQFYFSFE